MPCHLPKSEASRITKRTILTVSTAGCVATVWSQLTIERDLSTKSARESVEAAERKCALQTQALARSEAWAATAESSLQAAEECSEAAREEDKEAIRREAAIRESLEAEVRAWKHADAKGRVDIRPMAIVYTRKRNKRIFSSTLTPPVLTARLPVGPMDDRSLR